MSGHSKFANIKHKKEKNDAAKGKIKYLGEEEYSDEELSYINNSIKNEMAMNNLAIKRDYFTHREIMVSGSAVSPAINRPMTTSHRSSKWFWPRDSGLTARGIWCRRSRKTETQTGAG